WNNPYIYIRRANLIIEGVASSNLSDAEKTNFTAIARMIRGYQYFQLVRAYGDVPLVTKALQPDDREEIFGPRTNRNTVMDYALEDLSYAVANIGTKKSKNAFSADLAAAIKSEVCLYEGTYAKYHQNDNARANKFFNEVVSAATPLISAYPIGDNYQAIYNSFRGALSANPEIIFMKEYEKDVFMHPTVDYTSSSTPISGITKDAFDAYLFKDGKPKALTAEDNSDAAVLSEDPDGPLSIAHLLAVRDGRLSQTIDDVVYFTGRPYKRENSMPMTSVTGYGVKKYVSPEMDYTYTTTIWNYTCAPLFWGAYVALNYAEAKAELGTLTDADLDLTINKLFARADLPATTVAALSAMNDPANNMGVSSLLWEIRRCRRCELIYDKDLRYWDLVRWHNL
ncbi:MAG: RagB/SusD family nutrient uptake outer membrane protein, partial [Muribaculaceae bacterium]|nr:RagB/SusD family nutrient uptake outer membrane protein [Muribaculaceae bacterium]